ncbi:MAG: glycosyltransferase family 4 protein [Bacteroidales bacterium]|nr:glycosyltransferase family 4 protein [Bacteroidales bacterium]
MNRTGNISRQRKKAIVSVTNDLTTDQRVNRTCHALLKAGFEVLLVGRVRPTSKPLAPRVYGTHRMRLFFDKGALFYAEYNFRLLCYLLFHRFTLLVSNDTDALPANFTAHRLKTFFHPRSALRRPPVHLHDCHEYFRGVPELNGRKKVTWTWKWIEDRIFPRLHYVFAVNQSVADLYMSEYKVGIKVVRNVPFHKVETVNKDKTDLGIREDQKIILYQGAVNVDRGLEEAILSMKYLETDAVLLIAGTGDIIQNLSELIRKNGLSDKVMLLGQIPFQELHCLTQLADLGLSIEKDVSINYHYCLPNKFLDYIQARVPVLVSPFPEMKAIVDRYQIGEYIQGHEPEKLALQLDNLLHDQDKLTLYRNNMVPAAADLCWEHEETILLDLIHEALEN